MNVFWFQKIRWKKSLDEYIREFNQQSHKISWENIDFEIVKNLEKEEKLELYQIYNKDFFKDSEFFDIEYTITEQKTERLKRTNGKPGNKNLFTIYWENFIADIQNWSQNMRLNSDGWYYMKPSDKNIDSSEKWKSRKNRFWLYFLRNKFGDALKSISRQYESIILFVFLIILWFSYFNLDNWLVVFPILVLFVLLSVLYFWPQKTAPSVFQKRMLKKWNIEPFVFLLKEWIFLRKKMKDFFDNIVAMGNLTPKSSLLFADLFSLSAENFRSRKEFLEKFRHTWTWWLRKFFILKNTIPADVEKVLKTEERHIAEEIADYQILLKKWAELEAEKNQNLGSKNQKWEHSLQLSKKRQEVLLGNLEKISK